MNSAQSIAQYSKQNGTEAELQSVTQAGAQRDTQLGPQLGAQLSPAFQNHEPAHLTAQQRETFQRNGFLVLENVLSAEEIDSYREVVHGFDKTITHNYDGFQSDSARRPGDHLELRNAVAQSLKIRDLMVHPKTFPLIAALMGPHINLTTSHALLRPSSPADSSRAFKQVGWHRDGPAFPTCDSGPTLPWLYTKVGYFLTDTRIPDCGALRAVPGSHRYSKAPPQADGACDPYGAVEIGVQAGSAIIFDNRLLHAVGPNYSSVTRENIYMGYCWRHIRPIDFVQQEADIFKDCTSVQRQLLGASQDACGYFLPQDGDVPLEAFLHEMEKVHDLKLNAE